MMRKLKMWLSVWWRFGVSPWQFERDVKAVRQMKDVLKKHGCNN